MEMSHGCGPEQRAVRLDISATSMTTWPGAVGKAAVPERGGGAGSGLLEGDRAPFSLTHGAPATQSSQNRPASPQRTLALFHAP